MPSYRCTTVRGRLSPPQRAELAGEITRVHHDVTGAPTYFARLAFDEAEPRCGVHRRRAPAPRPRVPDRTRLGGVRRVSPASDRVPRCES